MSRKITPGVSRRAEHRKAVPFTVTDIGDKAALEIWRSEQVRKEDLFRLQRQATRDRAVQAFNQGGGHHTEWVTQRSAELTAVKAEPTPVPSWFSRAKTYLSRLVTSIWRHANFGA